MKFSKQIFRKVLWAPTAFASVSLTLYLANLWLSQDSGKMLDNLPPPEQHDEKRKDDSSPENASPKGQDDETSTARQQVPPPPQPVSPPTPATPPKPSQEGQESNSNSTNGNTKPEKYIVLKIKEISENGSHWLDHHKNELLSSWKITKSVETLLGAIEQYLKEQASKKD